ncbi:MAG: hypothetical protein KJ697_04855 [Nanoarchaeota archaeon]|nr:hypothetical protein [Nanoarchaeota archaeon]
MIIGIIGVLLILVAWAVEAEESVRKHKSLIDLKFAIIYLVATSCLAIYSYQINDAIFFWFQIGLLAIVLFEIFYTIVVKKVHRR